MAGIRGPRAWHGLAVVTTRRLDARVVHSHGVCLVAGHRQRLRPGSRARPRPTTPRESLGSMEPVPPVAAPGTALLLDAAGTLLRPAEPVAETYARFAARFDEQVSPEQVAEALPGVMTRARPLRAGRPDWRAYWAEVVRVSTGCASPALLDALLRYFARAEAWRVAEGAEACARAVAEHGM